MKCLVLAFALVFVLVSGCNSDGGGGGGGSSTGGSSTGIAAPHDACYPYGGSYTGTLNYSWTDNSQNPPAEGIGTIKLDFVVSCDSIPGDDPLYINITSAYSDYSLYGLTMPTSLPYTDLSSSNSDLRLPPLSNPPMNVASASYGLTINPPNGHTILVNGPMIIDYYAGKIGFWNDPANQNGWSEGSLPDVPASATVKYSYKFVHD